MTTTSIDAGIDAGKEAGKDARSRPAVSTAIRRVFIEGFELIGRVGIYEHERRYEQRLVVSLDLVVADNYDGVCDELDGVYDYDHAIAAVRATVESRHFNLLETLAESIAQAVLSHADVLAIKVRLAKPDVLITCRAVGIEIERRKG